MTLEDIALYLVEENRIDWAYMTESERREIVWAWVQEKVSEDDIGDIFCHVPKLKPLIEDQLSPNPDLYDFREEIYRAAVKEHWPAIGEFLYRRWAAMEVTYVG